MVCYVFSVSGTVCIIYSVHMSKLPGPVIRVGVNSGIEWELNSIPDLIPGIGLGIGIEKKRNWN